VIPKTPEDFTVSWANRALASALAKTSAHVTSLEATYHEAPGQTADTVLLHCEYQGETNLPRHLFCKINSRNAETMEIVRSMDLYRREVAFYTQVGDVGLPVPNCYYGEFDRQRYEFVLVLEDLSAGVCPSWGISEDQALDAIRLLPAFHSRWWNSPRARGFDWAIQVDESNFWENLRKDLPVNLARAREKLGEDLSDQFVDIVNLALAKYDSFRSYLAGRPFALVHGDYHFKQIFFPRSNGAGRLAVFDWQFPFVAPGPWDLARVMAATLPTERRRRLQPELLAGYLDGLAKGGVEAYGRSDLGEDLASGSLINLFIHTNALGATDIDILAKEAEAYGRNWRVVVIDQMVDAALDHDTPGLLRSL